MVFCHNVDMQLSGAAVSFVSIWVAKYVYWVPCYQHHHLHPWLTYEASNVSLNMCVVIHVSTTVLDMV